MFRFVVIIGYWNLNIIKQKFFDMVVPKETWLQLKNKPKKLVHWNNGKNFKTLFIYFSVNEFHDIFLFMP